MTAEEAQDKPDEPKIIIDDDWKAQAQAEKERLARELDAPPAAPAGEAPAGETPAGEGEQPPAPGEQPAQRDAPEASFAVLVNSLTTQILFALGAIADPQTGKRFLDLAGAKYQIDILAVLEEKTKGNLTKDETKLLDRAMYETRMQYVQVAQTMA